VQCSKTARNAAAYLASQQSSSGSFLAQIRRTELRQFSAKGAESGAFSLQ